MRKVIRLGDPTTHGGTVVGAAANYTMDGIPVARMGDMCTCPIRGHSGCTIVEGDPAWLIGGLPVALEGHHTSCGAVLISTFGRLGRSYEGNGSFQTGKSAAEATTLAGQSANHASLDLAQTGHRFFLKDSETGKPLSRRKFIARIDGVEKHGTTDANGYAEVHAPAGASIRLHLVFEAPTGLLQSEET